MGTSTRRPLRAIVAVLGLLLAVALVVAGGLIDPDRTVHPDAASASGCPVEPDTSVTTTARIAWQPVANGDLVVKDKNWLASCLPNATIHWAKMSSGGDVLQAFGARSIDIAQVGSSPTVKGVSAPLDLDLQIVWLHDVIGKAESLVVRESSVTDLAGLSGKTVATPFGSTAHFSLMEALRQAELTSMVKLVNLAPDAMLGAWQRDEIDAAWVWDPTLTSLLGDGGHVIMSSADTAEAGAPTFDLEAATREFATGNAAFMTMWTKLQAQAAKIMNDDPDEAAAALAVQLGITAEEAEAQFPGYTYLTASDQLGEEYYGGKLPDVLLDTATFLKNQGTITAVGTEAHYADVPNSTYIKELS